MPGTTLSDVFTYRVTDTGRLNSLAELTIVIDGAHDNPVASDDVAEAHAAATNDSSLETNPSGNVILFPSRPGAADNGIDRDVDAPDRPSSNLVVNGAINKTEATYDPLVDTLETVTASGSQVTGQYGVLTIRANGSFTYNVDSANADVIGLALNQTLTETFTYQIVDTAGLTDTAQLVITVHGANDPPSAQTVFVDAVEAGGIANATPGINPDGDATTNDLDPDGDPLTVILARPGALADTGTDVAITAAGAQITGTYGTLTLRANGTFTYVLDNSNVAVEALRQPGDTLTERFTYTLDDGNGGSDQAEIVVVIAGRNDAPVAADDTATAIEAGGVNNGTAGTNPVGNVLSNDADVDGGETPSDLPAYPYGETKQVDSVRTGSEAGTGTAGVLGSELRGTYGWLQLNADGSYAYRVDNSLAAVQALLGNANTLSEQFSYTVVDASGAQDRATLTVTVRGANDAPTASNDVAFAVEAGGLNNSTAGTNPTGSVLTNDLDPDGYGETLTVVGVTQGATTGAIGTVFKGTYGNLTLNANGTYSYTVDNSNAAVEALRTNLNTLNDVFTYRINDIAGASSTASLTVTIRGRNDQPQAVNDTATAVEAGGTANSQAGSTGTGNVHSNDTDVDANDTKTVSGVRTGSEAAGGTLTAVSTSATINGLYGQLLISANGDYTYTINNALAAVQALKPGDTLTERFTYRTQDLAGAGDQAELTVTIQGAWDAPVAVNDQGFALADSAIGPGHDETGNVLTNDTDVDANDSKTVTGIRSGTEAAGGALTLVEDGTSTVLVGLYGELLIDPDGTYSYHVDSSNPVIIGLGVLGTVTEHFTYQVTDDGGLADLGQLDIVIRGGDQAPVAVDDFGVASDQVRAPQSQGNVLDNDFDIDLVELFDEKLEVTGVRTGAENGVGVDGVLGQVLQGRYGKLVLNADGSYTYNIDLNNRDVIAASGLGQVLQDVFTYTVSDLWGASDEGQLTIDLDIAAPFIPAVSQSGNLFPPLGNREPNAPGYVLGDIEPGEFIGPVVRYKSGISELASWRSDGSNVELLLPAEVFSETLAQQLRPVPGQFVHGVVQESSRQNDLSRAWILSRHGRTSLSADGLLSDPSVFAPLPVDMIQPKPLPDYLRVDGDDEPAKANSQERPDTDQPEPLPPLPAPLANGQSARSFSAQLQAAAHRLPPRGAASATQN